VTISQTTLRIGAVLGTIGAIVVLAASAQAATSKPAGMSQQAYAALTARSEALNKRYGNDWTRLSPGEFKVLVELFGAEVTTVPLQELRARVTRNTSLDSGHGNDASTTFARPGGFGWGDFGIGAAAMLGLVLLSGGLLAGAYFGRKIVVRPRPAQ
jgi:hypothetical protein